MALAILVPRRLKQIRKAIQGEPMKKPKVEEPKAKAPKPELPKEELCSRGSAASSPKTTQAKLPGPGVQRQGRRARETT